MIKFLNEEKPVHEKISGKKTPQLKKDKNIPVHEKISKEKESLGVAIGESVEVLEINEEKELDSGSILDLIQETVKRIVEIVIKENVEKGAENQKL
jgi:hypothetical protein